jgi:hypothetical protein
MAKVTLKKSDTIYTLEVNDRELTLLRTLVDKLSATGKDEDFIADLWNVLDDALIYDEDREFPIITTDESLDHGAVIEDDSLILDRWK